MTTFQQILDDARVVLNDQLDPSGSNDPRYTEAQLMLYARQALVEARRIRPDLFLSNLTGDFPAYAATDNVPVPEAYVVPLIDYVISRAEMRDDEFAVDGRAATLFQKFKSGLMGV